MEQCSRSTRKGEQCRLTLKGDKCPTHDCDLPARNAKVVAAYRRRIGDKAFKADLVGRRHNGAEPADYSALHEAARQHRLRNPSWLEREVASILDQVARPYEREYRVLGMEGRPVDFAWPKERVVLEVDAKADFMMSAARRDAEAEKGQELFVRGYRAFYIRMKEHDPALLADYVLNFVILHNLEA
jgi:very-short-patch-repair endonuclease